MTASREDLLGPPRIRQTLRQLERRPLNFARAQIAVGAPRGWNIDDIRHPLSPEPPGPPCPGQTFEIAARLIRGYEFADPSIVRAYYDPDHPLEGRTMVLRLRALGLFQVLVGVRILEVIDETYGVGDRVAQVWGWRYGTLEGHIEQGEMSWEVWKWLDTGEVDFRIHAVSRGAHIGNPIVAVGVRLFGPLERRAFLRSTQERMVRFTELTRRDAAPETIRAAAAELTARPMHDAEPAHDAVADSTKP